MPHARFQDGRPIGNTMLYPKGPLQPLPRAKTGDAARPTPKPAASAPRSPIHLHLHSGTAPVRDRPAARPAPRRSRDQDPAEGASEILVCRVRQDGSDGTWSGEDAAGNAVRVVSDAGGLAVYATPQNGGDSAALRGYQMEIPGATGDDASRMAARLAPSQHNMDNSAAGVAGLQEMLNRHYRR
jgi:hypothetical protein